MKVNIKPAKKKQTIQGELHSQFIEFLGACIYDGIWVGEESSIPNYQGIRKDFVDTLKLLKPPIIRWPGGCYADMYHWRNGIGPRSQRPITYNENFDTYTVDTNEFGLHEFMLLCELVGAKPWLNINMLTGSVAEMREWMEYCNRREITSLSLERGQNGSKDPFEVEYWGVGNESWCGGGTMTAEQYATEYRKYASAFPVFDHKQGNDEAYTLKRIACGPDGNKPIERVKWTRDFFETLSQYRQPKVDAYDLHFYNWNTNNDQANETNFTEEEWYEVINSSLELEKIIHEQLALIEEGLQKYPDPENPKDEKYDSCDLIVGEWGNWHASSFKARPALFQQCTMRDAITTALTLDIFHRNCDKVKIACVAQTVNVLNSLMLTEGDKFLLTPNFDVFMMYKAHRGNQLLELTPETGNKDIHLLASENEEYLYVNVINADIEKEISVEFTMEQAVKLVKHTELHSEDVRACNTFDEPDKIRAIEKDIAKNGYTRNNVLEVKPASVNVFQFKK